MTSSPANRYRFSTLIISFGGSGWDGPSGVATDCWKDVHKASRALQSRSESCSQQIIPPGYFFFSSSFT
jgi:hypothetical protein